MESRAKLLGHSIHQILIVFPLGLLSTAVIFDLVQMALHSATMAMVTYWVMAAGIIGGLVAAPFGTIDWLAIPRGTRAASIGLSHGVIMFTVVLLFIASFALRFNTPETPPALATWIAVGGGVLALIGGWLGGELVTRLSVGVDDGANLNAPSSLRGRVLVKRPQDFPQV
jgi:uncharacterized membrane protein